MDTDNFTLNHLIDLEDVKSAFLSLVHITDPSNLNGYN